MTVYQNEKLGSKGIQGALVILLVLGLFMGGLSCKASTTTTTPTPTTTTPTPTPTPEIPTSGSGIATVEVADNPGNHPIEIAITLTLSWDIFYSTIIISGIPNMDSALIGILEADGTFFATTEGTYDGYYTSYDFDGIITPEGISGMLIIGADTELPGGDAIVYQIEILFM